MTSTAESLSARAAARAPRSFRRPAIITTGVVLLVAAVTLGYHRWSIARQHETTDNAQVDGHITPVLARVGGFVKGVYAAENDTVRAGRVLVELDDEEYRLRLAQTEAELAAVRATAGGHDVPGQAQAQVNTATRQQSALEAQLLSARSTAARAHADLTRYEDLAAKQIVSRTQLDAARNAAEAADAGVVQLQRQIDAAGASVSGAEAGVRLARARLVAAQAAVDNARLQLEYTHILAPRSGLVARRQLEVGQLVQPGQPMMSIVSDSGLWVTANFKETQIARLHPGQPVEIRPDAYHCTAVGRVGSIGSATGARFALLPPDNASGNFTKVVQRVPVRIEVTRACSPDQPLRPGMSVEVDVLTRLATHG